MKPSTWVPSSSKSCACWATWKGGAAGRSRLFSRLSRLLNRAMHQALGLAFRGQAGLVDAEVAMAALELLGLGDQPDGRAEGPSLAARIEAEEEPEACVSDGDAAPLLALEEPEGRVPERTSLALPDTLGPRRPSASPRWPA